MGVGFLILTIYSICVIYVLYQMALSVEDKLEDQIEIVLEADNLKAAVNAQLQQQQLYQAEADVQPGGATVKVTFFNHGEAVGVVGLQVSPVGKRPLQPAINTLSVSIINTLPDQQVFIDWDRSAISVSGGFAQRVIRQVPGNATDLLQPQVATVVNPGLQANASVTGEGLLNRPNNQMTLEVGSALVDLSKIPAMKESMRQYSLQMLVWVRSMTYPDSPALQIIVPFTFRIEVLPDHVALPVLSWLLNFNPFAFNPLQK